MDFFQSTIIVVAIIIGIFLLLYFVPIGLWFAATISGVKLSIFELILMRIRKSPIQEIVKGLIISVKGKLNLTKDEIEAFGLAGGNIENVVNAMVVAKKAGLELSFKDATKADLNGINIFQEMIDKYENQKIK